MELLPWQLAALLAPLIILLVTAFHYLISTGNKRVLEKNLPPQAAGGWPLIGHLRLLSGPELPHIILSDMADEYGPVFSIRMGVHRALIVSSWEIAKECFTTNDKIFCDRPRTAAIQHMSYDFAMFGLGKSGPYWRELRKISVQKLLSNRKIETLGHLYASEIRAMMRSLYNSCVDGTAPSALEMRKVFKDLSLKVMVRIVAGNIVAGSQDGEEGLGAKWHETITEFFRAMGVLTVPDVLPYMKWLDWFGGMSKGFEKTGRMMDSLLQEWVEEHKTRSGTSERDESFMAEMMRVADGIAEEFPDYDADTITKATCQTMILGGSDTTTVTLIWALCLLLNNQHTLRRAQEELDKHIGRERLVKESDIDKLVYIKAIIKETLRIQPSAPLLPPRESVEDCTVAGYHIPAGTRLILNVWKLHRDPRVWDDPLEFRPERFLVKHKEVDVQGKHYELLPFGGGRRSCPGISFAVRVMELALASFLHEFEIEKFLDEAIDMTGSFGSTNMKATPLEVFLKPRLSPDLYV
ncbi:Xanthotoxin 5-hydroxylase CYP82C4 [Sesamum angolense]|uniref:Flavonoid-6-hydroxylase n=1 Tax=Sesamum angolense TaxID=2727404 RepID=A0AAE2BQA0_9LAMI|nr:Xanthotoxin 5-hydroxylase CYP82C4 [Sesamum angolense]